MTKKNDFTVKQVKIRGRLFIVTWKKGRKGIFSIKQKRKGDTVKETKKTISKASKIKKEDMQQVFRVLKAKIYFYSDDTKVGQIRIVIHTANPNKFTPQTMNNILNRAEKYAMSHIHGFDKAMRNFVRKHGFTAREIKRIDIDEFQRTRRKLNTIFVEVAGLGVTRKGINTVGFTLR